MDWRHTEILKLLDSYRQYECLWNTHSPDYKQQEMRKGSWIALSKEFGKKVDDIKKKIKHLRTCYMAEKKKVESRRDSNGDLIYESHLYYYKQMSFLDPVIVKKPSEQPAMSNRTQKRERSVSTDSEKEEPQRELRTSISRLDSSNPAFRATLRFNPIQTAKYGLHQQRVRSLSLDSEKEETQQELNTTISRLDSTNSSPKAYPRFISKSTVRRTNDVPKTQPPKKIVKHSMLSKEDTFCAMLCSELKLLKSEETYDNVTSDIFAAVRSAKIAERQMELEGFNILICIEEKKLERKTTLRKTASNQVNSLKSQKIENLYKKGFQLLVDSKLEKMTILTKPSNEKMAEKVPLPLTLGGHDNASAFRGGVTPGTLLGQSPYHRYVDGEPMVCNRLPGSCIKSVLLFLIAVVVMVIGLLGGYTLYRSYSPTGSNLHYRALCHIPYMATGNKSVQRLYEQNDELDWHNLFSRLTNFNGYNALDDDNFREEIELDLSDNESYANIDVPDFKGGRRGRFMHDFKQNQSAIIDTTANRCFIMPLDRDTTLPPKSFLDLVQKMGAGYYNIDTNRVRRNMRVVTPPITDLSMISERIANECYDMKVYMLENNVSKVFKRDVKTLADCGKFAGFMGKGVVEFNLINIDDIEQFEKKRQ